MSQGDDGAPTGVPPRQGPGAPRAPVFVLPRTAGETAKKAAYAVLSLALTVGLLGWGLPYITDTSWATILSIVTGIGWPMFFLLLGLMFLGLYCYTFTLTGSLPGLKHGQAILANLAGSGVSNMFPGGGAMGAAITYAMFRSWRFSHRSISTSIVVTTVWNVLARVLLPALAALFLIPEAGRVPPAMIQGALAGGLGGAVTAGVLIAVIASRRAARALGRAGDRLLGPVVRRLRPSAGRADIEELALDVRDKIIDLVRTRWASLSFGVAGFMGVFFLLFYTCLMAVGVQMTWSHAFAAYAVGRLLSTVAVTPGGIGVSEAGTATVMVALGAPGEGTAAAVTLFAIFSFLLEIPFGALAILIWSHARGRDAVSARAVTERGAPER